MNQASTFNSGRLVIRYADKKIKDIAVLVVLPTKVPKERGKVLCAKQLQAIQMQCETLMHPPGIGTLEQHYMHDIGVTNWVAEQPRFITLSMSATESPVNVNVLRAATVRKKKRPSVRSTKKRIRS